MLNTIRKFKNANYFIHHLYAYKTLWARNRKLKKGIPVLFNAELFFDTACNFKCKHCSISGFQDQPNYKNSMTLNEIIRVADELKNENCFLCCLVGGEITLRPDIFDIISVFHSRCILPTIITNGYTLDTKIIKKMKKAGIFNIGVSLNGFTSDTHNSFVNKPGAFEKALLALDLIKRENICTSIAFVPTHKNIENGEYDRVIQYAQKNKIRVNINYPALTGRFTGNYDELLNKSELIEVKESFKLSNVTSDFTVLADKYECPAGRKKIYILSDGSVCPCTFIHISFGNVLKEPLKDIMKRIWDTKIFMSKPKVCLVGENVSFIKKYLEPVFNSPKLPIYYLDHPEFK